jgi:ribose 1,5-bisphosphokinase
MTPQAAIAARAGRLVYVIGASGAGKDSIIAYARDRLGAEGEVPAFARRHITRPAGSGGEDHIPLSPDAFERDRAAGRFTLSWRGNGLGYGVGTEIETWLAAGRHVVLNGSRGYLAEAKDVYPDLLPVLIDIDPAVLRRRLLARGRETPAEVEERIQRAMQLAAVDDPALVVISNNGPLTHAGEAFLALLRGL